MATNTTEEIIEKRQTSPLATSCLALAIVAIIGAITLQIMEMREIRADWSSTEKNNKSVKSRVDAALRTLATQTSDSLTRTSVDPAELDEAKEVLDRDGSADGDGDGDGDGGSAGDGDGGSAGDGDDGDGDDDL